MRIIKRLRLLLFFLIMVSFGIYFFPNINTEIKQREITNIYHQSQFFQYADLIDSSVEKISNDDKINFDQVLGGVVSHHLPTTIPALTDFYVKLKNNQIVKTFIILGPDHINKSKGDINISKADFITPFGRLKPDLDLINKLEQSGLVINDETPFDKEHSIDSQMLFINKFFPDARVVPIIFRSNLANETAKKLGSILAQAASEDTFIVASVDFSHYLSEQQARPLDQLSADVLNATNPNLVNLIEADSPQALVAFMTFLNVQNAQYQTDLQALNTKDFNNNEDYTTGYVFGFWGLNNQSQ